MILSSIFCHTVCFLFSIFCVCIAFIFSVLFYLAQVELETGGLKIHDKRSRRDTLLHYRNAIRKSTTKFT